MSNNNTYSDIVKHLDDFRSKVLARISRWSQRRRIPPNLRAAVFSSWNQQCAICGWKNGSLEAAHIEPVEEGGETEPIRDRRKFIGSTNLIPLCKRDCQSLWEAREKEKSIDDVGCHKLYDNEGAWTRQQIRHLLLWRSNDLARPNAAKQPLPKPEQFEALKERVEHKISWPSKGSNPLPEIKIKLGSANLKCSEKIDLLICGLRLARRPFPRKSPDKFLKEVDFFDKKLSELEMSARSTAKKERILYERAMVHFEFAEFDKALKLLRSPKGKSSSFIKEAQACVCEFEIERAKNTPSGKRIRRIISSLENEIIPGLDRLAKQKKSWGARKTWPVTARLHIARMKAYLDDASAWRYSKDAVRRRDRQLNADVWKYSLDEDSQEYKNLEAISGWSRYTQVLLLHAKGESRRACAKASESLAHYRIAAEFLALAARRIIQDRYKNFEYLDNVLEGLQKIPNKVLPDLDNSRKDIEDTRSRLAKFRFLHKRQLKITR